jgi:enterochelin esterase-like enzyme
MKYPIVVALLLVIMGTVWAQNHQITPGDTLHSLTMAPDGSITFRIYAPEARGVAVGRGDIPEPLRKSGLAKMANGVWEGTLGPLAPGAYRYVFTVDQLSVMDPRNPSVSESNENAWSLLYVPGADFMEVARVPHGAVAAVTYYSHSLQRFRRMHVYTPPGYEAGDAKYPVFYLLHGAFDCDDSWSTVGRAGIILDNLIAAGKAVPMVVVMPAGHTGPFSFGGGGRSSAGSPKDEFLEDFTGDVRPYVESHYRVFIDRRHRAIAGLSMGGAQTLNIAMAHLADYSSFGVFSSGLFELGGNRAGNDPTWEDQHLATLDNPELKRGLAHVWFATGKDDFLLQVSRKTVDLLTKHGFTVEFHETAGGHTWINWREYLRDFAPLLFH